jgi:hypothetical protein
MSEELCPLRGQHIMVAIPSYDGKIPASVVNSLFGLQQLIQLNQGKMSFIYQQGMALVTAARNGLLAEVMKHPDVTGVLHLDADIEFDPMDALSLIAYADERYDMVAGLYRAKTDKSILYFVTWDGDGEPELSGEVLPCKRVPLGFAYVKRNVLDTLWRNAEDKPYKLGPNEARIVFETPYKDGVFIGEDYDFCDKVREAGFKIGALPRIELGHIGHKSYRGAFWQAIEASRSGELEVISGSDDSVIL